jgi:hypothetical protein
MGEVKGSRRDYFEEVIWRVSASIQEDKEVREPRTHYVRFDQLRIRRKCVVASRDCS